jgi:hypothetical protein
MSSSIGDLSVADDRPRSSGQAVPPDMQTGSPDLTSPWVAANFVANARPLRAGLGSVVAGPPGLRFLRCTTPSDSVNPGSFVRPARAGTVARNDALFAWTMYADATTMWECRPAGTGVRPVRCNL